MDQFLGQFLERLASPVSSFLSYSIFLLIPIWSIKDHQVYLFAWASNTHARGSSRWVTLSYLSGHLCLYIDGESLLTEALLAFYANQGLQPLSLLYSLNCKIIPYLSSHLYISLAMPFPLRITLDPPRLVPSNVINQQLSQIEKKNITLSLYSANLQYINKF